MARKNSTNRTVAAPKYHESRHKTNKNATKARVSLDGNVAENASTLSEHATEFFGPVARRFKADASYGRQHFNQEGFLHPDGALRLSNVSLAMMGAQIMEVLAQRASKKGNKPFTEQIGEGGDPALAAAALSALRQFASNRPKEIAENEKAGIYGKVMADLGIDASEMEEIKKKNGKKSGKAKAKAKDEAPAEATA